MQSLFKQVLRMTIANSDLAPFSISGFQRREAPPKPAFTVRALRARTVNAKGARSELTMIHHNLDKKNIELRGKNTNCILQRRQLNSPGGVTEEQCACSAVIAKLVQRGNTKT